MRSVFVVSALALATGVFAQSSSYIPTDDISPQCSDFLNDLNNDPALLSCTSTLLSATKAFSSSSSSANISSTLNDLCSEDANACANPETRSLLSQFFQKCTPEIDGENPNEAVQELYDLLYLFTPFRAAVCATDSSTGARCVSNLAGVTPAARKRDNSLPYVNPAQMRAAGTPYLFLTPSDSADTLCKPCTKSILQSWVTWEYLMPYGPGLLNSQVLGGQADLWSAVGSKCGDGFLSAITADAGAAPLEALASGASQSMKAAPAFLATIVVGLGAALLM